MTSLILIILLGQLLLALFYKRLSLLVAIASIPLYLVWVYPLGIPLNPWEALLLISFVGFLLSPEFLSEIGKKIPPLSSIVPTGLVAIGLVVGVFMAQDTLSALGIIKSWFLIPAIAGILVYINFSIKDANLAIAALVVPSLIISSLALYQFVAQEFVSLDGRATAWFSSPNYLGLYLSPILLLSLWNTLNSKGYLRLLNIVVSVAGMATLILSNSIGSLLALGVGWGVGLIFIISKRRTSVLGRFVVFGSLLVAALALAAPYLAASFNFIERQSWAVRQQVWAVSGHMIQDSWMFGQGLGSFEAKYLGYARDLFPNPLETNILHSHHLLFEWWINAGILGLIGFVGIVIQWLRQLLISPNYPLTVGLLAAMVAILVHGLIDVSYFKNDLSAIFAIIVSLTYVSAKETI